MDITTDTDTNSPSDRPVWEPLQAFPVDLDDADLGALLGALAATLEHQQMIVQRSESTLVGQLGSFFTSPALYATKFLELGHYYEAKTRGLGRRPTHSALIDAIAGRLPDQLPRFIPVHRRWISDRAYRLVRSHLWATFTAYKIALDLWKAGGGSADNNVEQEAPKGPSLLEIQP